MFPRSLTSLFWTSIFIGLSLHGKAADLHVALSGNDSNPGTAGLPWRTIQKAASSAQPGDTVHIAAGTYREKVVVGVSGNAVNGPITFQPESNASVVLDGGSLRPTNANSSLIDIADQSYLTIRGITIQNLHSRKRNLTPVGIQISGACRDITIEGCLVRKITNTFDGPVGRDAHGIAVFGSDPVAMSGITITGCTISNLILGSSEALVVNGNVDGFSITNNTVHHCDNIGIDAIGYEGIGPDPATDRARNGIIAGNHVYQIDSFGNPAYGDDRSAGGIYVDGGADILIEHNRVHHCNIGIELASEHRSRSTENIEVRNNMLYLNDIGGLFMGGYDTRRGSTVNCRITHNIFDQNDRLKDGNGEILLQFDVRNCEIKNNILIANSQKLFVGNPFGPGTGNLFDYNLYSGKFAIGKARWEWRRKSVNGLITWRNRSGQGAHSFFASPGFTAPGNRDYRIGIDSPAIDAGDPSFTPALGHLDLDGDVPNAGGTTDIGLDEFAPGSGPFALRVTGNGIAIPKSDRSPRREDGTHFGNVTVGSTTQQVFDVRNRGAGTVDFGNPKFTYQGSPNFSITHNLPASLAAGESASVTATYTSQSLGPTAGLFELQSNAEPFGIHSFTIRATGTFPGAKPKLKVTGKSIRIPSGNQRPRNSNGSAFARRPANKRPITRRFRLKNTGEATVFLNQKRFQIIGGGNQFTLKSSLPSFLDPKTQSSFLVRYTPKTRRPPRASVRIISIDPNVRDYNFQILGSGR